MGLLSLITVLLSFLFLFFITLTQTRVIWEKEHQMRRCAHQTGL